MGIDEMDELHGMAAMRSAESAGRACFERVALDDAGARGAASGQKRVGPFLSE